MKVVSFNVNSIRMRLHQLQALIEKHSPDYIGLQETKVADEQFPVADINALGYEVVFHGQKTHYGVAILSKHPIVEVMKGFPGDDENSQKRFIAIRSKPMGEFGPKILIINGYFPQGENRDHPVKFPNKARFYQDLNTYLDNFVQDDEQVIVMGDMNISPTDNDIGIGEDNKKRWLRTGKCSFLPEEREWLNQLYSRDLIDTFRLQYPETNDTFSWFDYRSKGFEDEPKRGLRIDLILASKKLAEATLQAGIDYDIRGMEKPSDHAPIWTEFLLKP